MIKCLNIYIATTKKSISIHSILSKKFQAPELSKMLMIANLFEPIERLTTGQVLSLSLSEL
jgi:hypothetical protein